MRENIWREIKLERENENEWIFWMETRKCAATRPLGIYYCLVFSRII